MSVSLARSICTVYLLPVDFLLARGAGMDELRMTDEVLGIRVVEEQEDAGAGGAGGYVEKDVPVAAAEAA